MTSTLQQIKENAVRVNERFAAESGLIPFAYTAKSVDYLEEFLVREETVVRATPLSINKYVHLLGSYLGECILANYGGKWQESPEGMAVMIQTRTHVQQLHPFGQVYKRITKGTEHDLGSYFSRFIPETLAST